MFFEEPTGTPVNFKSQEAGLFIQKRDYSIVKLDIPENCLCLQIGELTQIVSGGLFKAMPHAVRMPSGRSDISRTSFAVFMEPNLEVRLNAPEGISLAQVYT